MSAAVVSGERWEFRERYISPERAQLIKVQAKWLMQQTAYCLASKQHRSLQRGNFGFTSTTLHLEGSTRNKGLPTLEQYPYIEDSVKDLVELFEKTSLETGDQANVISMLRYSAYGRLGWHRDESGRNEADDTISITTAGKGYLLIKDPHYGIVRLITKQGDAVFLDNSGAPDQRLDHRAGNLSVSPRVVYVD